MRSDVGQTIERVRGRYTSTELPPATPDDIARAEAALGVVLPPSYRELVSAIAPPYLPGLSWVGGAQLPKYLDIVDASRAAGNLPPFLVSVLTTADGDQICFDTRHAAPDGEYPLVQFNHEIHHEESTEFEPIGQTFTELMEALLLPPASAE
jgi:hypothetical protein